MSDVDVAAQAIYEALVPLPRIAWTTCSSLTTEPYLRAARAVLRVADEDTGPVIPSYSTSIPGLVPGVYPPLRLVP